MEFFRISRDIPFMRHALVLNIISFLTFAAAVFFIATRGLHLSIEFTGGTVMEVEYNHPADINKTREAVESLGFGEVQVQKFGTSRDVLIRLPVRGEMKQGEVSARTFEALCSAEQGTVRNKSYTTPQGEQVSRMACVKGVEAAADGVVGAAPPAGGASPSGSVTGGASMTASTEEPLKLSRTEFIGPAVGSELARDGALALLFTVVGIMLYLAMRFEWKFSVAGIIANLHDVIIILGFFAFFQWEFSLPVLAAILAVLGYSVNESVVIFDRIREVFRKYRKLSTPQVIDNAITSTISRTVITHGSTQIMVLSMLIFGGPTLFYFALALTIGILFGIYSSIFVAAGIAMWLGVQREDLIKGGPTKTEDPNDPNAGAVV
ncbi:MAG: protein translocase subunit SecF [Betaproteobacteria bacterium]|nr:protein translocase subunit SecF [Betaproteobacteria bacterium]NBT11105.1 protein translocase subunit SecF [Betaproteobacteria bacterium]NBU49651.1 protein translocase subunit SecF [Betaproteobacteria bacterium]NBX95826.1 protein translocase subunit SecF [Betaproteobacteria bacterium]